MHRARFVVPAALALAVLASFSSARAQSGVEFRPEDQGFVARMSALGQRYPGQLTIARLNNRPAVFIKTRLAAGQLEQFKGDLLAAMGCNRIQAHNAGGHLHVTTGSGTQGSPLRAEYQGRNIDIYSDLTMCDFELPSPSERRTAVMFKLEAPKLREFDTYVNRIVTDFHATLGAVEFEGRPAPPPYFSGNPDNKHNCTTWLSYFLNRRVDRTVQSRHSPYMFCKQNARTDARSLGGLLIFNHPDAPQDGASLPDSFLDQLRYE